MNNVKDCKLWETTTQTWELKQNNFMNPYLEKIIKDNEFNFEVNFDKYSVCGNAVYTGHKDNIYCLIYYTFENCSVMYFEKTDDNKYVPVNQDGYFLKIFHGEHVIYRYRIINSLAEGKYLEFIEYYSHGRVRLIEYYEIIKPISFRKVKELTVHDIRKTYKVFKNPRPNSILFKFNKKFNEFYYNKKGEPHRLDGPAERSYTKQGTLCVENYYKNGVCYRKNGPASIYYDLDENVELKIYYKDGIKSRQVRYDAGRVNEILIYNEGVIDREQYPADYYFELEKGKLKSVDVRWCSKGLTSNRFGAARILIAKNKTIKEYYVDGKQVDDELQLEVMKKVGSKYERRLITRIRKLIKKEEGTDEVF